MFASRYSYIAVNLIGPSAQIAFPPEVFSPGDLYKEPAFGWFLGYGNFFQLTRIEGRAAPMTEKQMKRTKFLILPVVLVCGAIAWFTDPAHADEIGQATVIDGDTLEIHGVRFRLHGVDAPESSQSCRKDNGDYWSCGQQAATALADHIGRATVHCDARDQDRYGRVISVCSASGEDLNHWLVESGWAVAYRQYSTDYVSAEENARSIRRGVWSGDFVMPWDWRRGKRLSHGDNNPADTDCLIKGNVSSKGERIYHIPGGRWYARTKINTAKGERWFCSESDAEDAGWRRSKQ